jgi:glycosyltransferase involved in cell wall biosynthesis
MNGKKKLILIGHTYMVKVNRRKAIALSEYYEVLVCTASSKDWMVLGRELPEDDDEGMGTKPYLLKRLDRIPSTQDYTRFTLRGISDSILEFEPDIVLVENEPWSFLRWQVRWAAYRCAPDALFAEFTWENVSRKGIKGLALKLFYRLMAKTSQAVITGNAAAANLVKDAGVPGDNILVDGQLGVAECDFPLASISQKEEWRVDQGWPADCTVIGFCGRLVDEKGIMTLREAVAKLTESIPNLKLAILGSGPLSEKLEAADRQSDFVRVLAPVPHSEVGEFLNKLDIFVLPSKPLVSRTENWEEQFGHVLLEAIAAGALTIGSNSGAIPEVLNDSEMIFQHSDVDSLEAKLAYWLHDKELRQLKIGQQRKACMQRWGDAALATRYAEFLNSMMSRKAHGSNR